MSVTIWLKSIFESRLGSRPLSVATTGVDTAAEDGRKAIAEDSTQESHQVGIGRWCWIMQLVLARLREAWPLLLIALFALRRPKRSIVVGGRPNSVAAMWSASLLVSFQCCCRMQLLAWTLTMSRTPR